MRKYYDYDREVLIRFVPMELKQVIKLINGCSPIYHFSTSTNACLEKWHALLDRAFNYQSWAYLQNASQ